MNNTAPRQALAALSFFTRVPFWRICSIPPEAYKHVVDFWPLAGWLTASVTALVAWGLLWILPPFVAVMLAFIARLLLTGALHEDGLADFFDGMGGGRTRERTLEIMKDSNIGSYGVIALICYFLLLVSSISSLPPVLIPVIILAADPWSKFCGTLVVDFLPYARTAAQAKNRLVYDSMSWWKATGAFLIGILPALLFLPPLYWVAMALPALCSLLLILYMRHRIGGYTGDCCGATALLCELSFYLSALIIYYINLR